MQLLSVLNNTVQITYNPEHDPLKLGDMLEFVIPTNNGLIAQVFKLGFENDQYIACLRIFFTIKDGNWIKWLGNIPPKSSTIRKVHDQDILELFGQFGKNNINIGYMPQYGMNMQIAVQNLDSTFILFDNNQNKISLFDNLKDEFIKKDMPFIIFDFKGEYSSKQAPRITALKDFKLPLNVQTLTSIHEKNFQYSSAEMRVLFEDVIAQVKNFFQQSEEMFIPFKIFKSVVDNEKPSIELSLLKNLLDKYQEQNLFADSKKDFLRLKSVFKKHNAYIIDMSEVPEEWQKEYIHFVVQNLSKYFVLMEDCKLFKTNKDIEEVITCKKSVKFIMAVNYNSELLGDFINKAKNIMLCPPNKRVNYFPNLTDYLGLLSFDEFIYQGEQTKYLPVILQPKQENENRIIKQISTTREIVQPSEEVVLKPKKQDDIEDIISEIEVLHSLEDEIPLIQDPQTFEEITFDDISDLEELESLDELEEIQSDSTQETISSEENEGYQEYEIVEIQDEMDDDIDQLFNPDLIQDVDALMQGKALEKMPAGAKNVELHQKIEEERMKEYAQAQADAIDEEFYKRQKAATVQVETTIEVPNETLETLDTIEEYEERIEPQIEEQADTFYEELIEHDENIEDSFEDISLEDLEALDSFDIPEESEFEHITEEPIEEELIMDEPSIEETLIEEPIKDESIYSDIPLTEEPQPQVQEHLEEEPPQEVPITESIPEQKVETELEPISAQTPSTPPKQKVTYAPQEPVPEYPVEAKKNPQNTDTDFQKGDSIEHEKFGKGIIKKIMSHGSKKLYKIQFESSGIKLLDLETVKVTKS